MVPALYFTVKAGLNLRINLFAKPRFSEEIESDKTGWEPRIYEQNINNDLIYEVFSRGSKYKESFCKTTTTEYKILMINHDHTVFPAYRTDQTHKCILSIQTGIDTIIHMKGVGLVR